MPPRSNRRSGSWPPRRHDDWLVMLVALGTLGGAGWAMTSGFFSPLPTVNRTLQERPPLAAPNAVVPSDRSRPSEELLVPEPQLPETTATTQLAPIRSPLPFSDVAADNWAKPYIDALTARGVLQGLPDGTFAPDRPMTRAELAAQITNAFKIRPDAGTRTFADVPSDYWAKAAIDEAVAMGFLTGYPGDRFQPEQTIPRLQVLVALANGLSLPEPTNTDTERWLQRYQDQTEIPDWAQKQVVAAMQAGIIQPASSPDNSLRPNAPATRAEVATLIYNSLAYMGAVADTP